MVVISIHEVIKAAKMNSFNDKAIKDDSQQFLSAPIFHSFLVE